MKGLAAEEGDVGLRIEGPVDADADACADFAGGVSDYSISKTVERA